MTRHLLLIGAQRCGTTYLAALLDDHPAVTMARPARPEPKVFLSDEIIRKGAEWYRATYFSHAQAGQILGEKSTSYLEDAAAPARVAAVLGRAEIVVQLRDPVDRAVSNWRFSRKHGLEDRPLDEALEQNLTGPRPWDPALTSVSPYAYLERGRYIDFLEPWLAEFADSLHVTFLDDVIGTTSALADLYAALGVDPHHQPTAAGAAVNGSEGEMPQISPDLRRRLREYFAGSDARLHERLGRALPWVSGDRRDVALR